MQRVRGSTVRALAALAVAAVGAAALALGVVPSNPAGAHGSAADPPSRTYVCRFLEPDSPICATAWAANPQALYDWMEVNIGDVAGQHRARIPDGQLCSAGRAKYAAFDTPGTAWPATTLSRDADGLTRLTYEATAPHATLYFRYYLTREGFDPNQPLAWGDLELIYDSGQLPAEPSYTFDVPVPDRTGRHILYSVWQRSDSPEAFYACSDVVIGSGPPPPPPPTPTPTPTPSPTPTPPPPPPPPPGDDWSPTTTYLTGDQVTHAGQTYEAKWWTRGFAPDTPVANPWDSPWRLVETKPGPPTPSDEWSPTTVYLTGDQVTRAGQTYEAKWWTRGFAPDTPVANPWDSPWRLVS